MSPDGLEGKQTEVNSSVSQNEEPFRIENFSEYFFVGWLVVFSQLFSCSDTSTQEYRNSLV